MKAVVALLVGLVGSIDLASTVELRLAPEAHADLRHVRFAGAGTHEAELRQAVAAGVLVNGEDLHRLRALGSPQQALRLPVSVVLREPHGSEFDDSGKGMSGGPKKFGLDVEFVPDAMAVIRAGGLGFEDFQFLVGSKRLRGATICEARNKRCELARGLAADAPSLVHFLILGGGFGIPFIRAEASPELASEGVKLKAIFETARHKLPGARIVFEPGRDLFREEGIHVMRTIERMGSRGRVFLVTDGGPNHPLSASDNFG